MERTYAYGVVADQEDQEVGGKVGQIMIWVDVIRNAESSRGNRMTVRWIYHSASLVRDNDEDVEVDPSDCVSVCCGIFKV